MRKLWAIVALVGALAIVPMMTAFAGGNGAVKVDMYVAAWGGSGGNSAVIQEPLVDVGDVIANTTASGKLILTVKVKDGEPMADWTVRVIGSGLDLPDGDLTTNRSGKGNFHGSFAIPDSAPDPLTFSIVVRDGDRGESEHVYRSSNITIAHK